MKLTLEEIERMTPTQQLAYMEAMQQRHERLGLTSPDAKKWASTEKRLIRLFQRFANINKNDEVQ